MAKCSRIRRKYRKICIGDLNEQITLQDRAITAPVGESVDYGEDFTGDDIVWAMINTVKGRTTFDSTDTERVVTHEVGIRFIDGITSETWFKFNGEMYDIIDVESLDERDDFLLFDAAARGDSTVNVNLS